MRASLVFATIAALSSQTSAHRTGPARHQVASINTWFKARNFEEGCSPGGCEASFNLTANADSATGMPGFDVVCHPIYIQQGFVTCDAVTPLKDKEIVASWWTEASVEENIKLVFEHIWLAPDGNNKYNASGSVEFPGSGVENFTVHITNLTVIDLND
ncbi:hypothetical protein F5Y16DRAFT_351602 [Xylariaceae sp. FL0255]|nr:hypothetical protein F5Y16DRAFT_351602 [Xylariaceae sp. FL0255]